MTRTKSHQQGEFYELTEAKAIIAYVHPFINSILYDNLTVVVDDPDDQPPTLATDGDRLLVNSEYFKTKLSNVEFRVAALAHEILHAMFMHPDRFQHYRDHGLDGSPVNPMALNMAADFIINDFLRVFRIGMLHPSWLWRNDVSYEDSLEDVYRRIVKKGPCNQPGQEQGRQGQQGQQQGKPGQGQGQGQSQSQQGQDQDDVAAGEGSEGGDQGVGYTYSIKAKDSDEEAPINPNGQFDQHLAHESSKGENEWHAAVQAAMQSAKSIGRLPADMERALQKFLTIEKDWREELADQIRFRTGFDTRNIQKPNKRRLYQDRLYIPTRNSWEIDRVALIFDVSGSVSMEETALYCGTVADILSQCHVRELRCLCVNSTVMDDVTFDSVEDFMEWRPHGSGGTDMEAGLTYLDEDQYDPDICIVLTDGYTNTSEENMPSFPVVWVTTGQENLAYGKVIKMEMKNAA